MLDYYKGLNNGEVKKLSDSLGYIEYWSGEVKKLKKCLDKEGVYL